MLADNTITFLTIMAIEGYVKFEYYSKAVPPYYNHTSFPELVDDEKITIETPNLEMSYHQYFALFKKFLMAAGFDEKNVMQGACHLAFNESNREETMRAVAEEYDLIMGEQLPDIIADSKKQDEEWIEKNNESWEQRYWALYRRFNKFARFTDEQLDNMIAEAEAEEKLQVEMDMETLSNFLKEDRVSNFPNENRKWKKWVISTPGSEDAIVEGCTCPVLDNQEMPPDRKWVNGNCPLHGLKDDN